MPTETYPMPRAFNCGDIRSGMISWDTVSSSDVDLVLAKQAAIEGTLVEMVKQLAGTNIKSLSQNTISLSNDVLNEKYKLEHYVKIKGRVIDYNVIDIKHTKIDDSVLFHIELRGNVCADDIIEPPLIVALQHPAGVSANKVDVILSSLSKNIAKSRRLSLIDDNASEAYHDINITISLEDPRTWLVDRHNAIKTIQSNLGRHSAEGIDRYVTRVSLRVSMNASMDNESMTFIETEKIERDIGKYESPSIGMISEMESEVVNITAKKLIDSISKYVMKRNL